MQVTKFTVKETAQEIRKSLKVNFPGVKFSLRMSRGTGHGWMHVDWTDGPTQGEVRKVTDGFRSSYFDGMDDSTHSIPSIYTCNGVNGQRAFSPEALQWARERVAAHPGRWERETDWLDSTDPLRPAAARLLSGTRFVQGEEPEEVSPW